MTAQTVSDMGDTVSIGRILYRTVAAEQTRLWSVKATWWFVAVAATLMVGLGAVVGFEAAACPPDLAGEPAWTAVRFLALPAQFALLALAVTAVTSDYATGGIVPTLQWTPRRTILLTARTMVIAVIVTSVGVILAAACALAAFATARSALTLPLGDGLDRLASIAFVFAAGTVIAASVGFLLRSTAGALVTVFLLMLVLPVLLRLFGEWASALAELLPGSGAIFLIGGQVPGMTTTSSLIVMLAWALTLGLLGWLRLLRTDAHR